MSEYLDTIHDGRSVIREIAENLLNISSIVYRLGMNRLAKDLSENGYDLFAAERRIGDAVAKDLNDQIQKSQEMSKTILMSALAGMEIARQEGTQDLLDTQGEMMMDE